MNIIFWGTPHFAKIILERLIKTNYKPILVVTQPDMPVGRKQTITPPPVKVLSKQNKIPIFQPKNLKDAEAQKLKTKKCDLGIVAAYGKIIPWEILEIPRRGTLNVHPSLLPCWRGPSPIQYTILNGDQKTGVSIILMDEKIDHGPIVANKKFEIKNRKFTSEELTNKLAELSANLLIETIPKWLSGKVQGKEQDHQSATYSKILTKEDGHIDWTKSAEEIERQIRAFTPWPESFVFWKNKRIKIIQGHALEPHTDVNFSTEKSPGEVFVHKNQLAVQAAKGLFIIEILKLEGKNKMMSKEFLNGYSEIINVLLK